MNAGPTSDRVHDALRRLIMERRFRPGDRLDPAVIADMLAASTTPVREALNQLAGEGMVETRPSAGFVMPLIDEPGLKDLYAWSGEIILLALRDLRRPTPPAISRNQEVGGYADHAAILLLNVARASNNREHGLAMERINLRLHAIRLGEPAILPGVEEELARLDAAVAQGDFSTLRKLSASYHRRRLRAAADLLRDVYRSE